MRYFKNIFLVLAIVLNGNHFLFAQPTYNNCSNALEICPNTTVSVNNIGANKTLCTECEDDFIYCFTANNTIWLKFTTKNTGGDVQIDFSNLVFENNSGQATKLQATLIAATLPCASNSFTQIGNCISNSTGNFSLNASGLSGNTTYYILINGDKTGVGITKAAECTFNIVISGTAVDKAIPTMEISSNTLNSCKDDIVTLKASIHNCPDSTKFLWFVNGELKATTKDTIFQTASLKTGDVVSVSNSCYKLCTKTISAATPPFTIFEINVNAGENVHILEGQSLQLQGTTSSSAFSWSPEYSLSSSSILTPIAIPTETTTYTLSVSENGCEAFDDITVFINQKLIIPTTFSPNNDDINDVFEIVGIENYPNCLLQIFDRWGQEVFQKTGYSFSKAWKGDFNGKELAAGVYFYSLELRDTEKQIKKGSVTIIR
jgi:gliding motility-associated-like protein